MLFLSTSQKVWIFGVKIRCKLKYHDFIYIYIIIINVINVYLPMSTQKYKGVAIKKMTHSKCKQ